MKKLKAEVGTLIGVPADALRSIVVDASLVRAIRVQENGAGARDGAVTER